MKELILQLFCPCLSFKVLFCCVIAEFAPNVTDMSHPGYFTHDALVVVVFFFYRPLFSCLKEQCVYCITFLSFKRIYSHCAV